MARPTKPIKRGERITVRYSKTELKFIEKMVKETGVEKAEFVRGKSLDHEIKPRLTEEQTTAYRQLTGMANNLNQLAKAANNREILTREILKTLEGINMAVAKLS